MLEVGMCTCLATVCPFQVVIDWFDLCLLGEGKLSQRRIGVLQCTVVLQEGLPHCGVHPS